MKCFVGNNCMVDDQSMFVWLNSRSRLLSGIVSIGCRHDDGEGMSKARGAVAQGAGQFRFQRGSSGFMRRFEILCLM